MLSRARMLWRKVRTLSVLVAVLLGALAVGTRAAPTAPRPRVAATIFPLFDIVRHVAGDVVEVVLILPPGASPHTFEPTPGQVRQLAGARAVFAIGHGLDDWAVDLARGAGGGRVVIVDDGIRLRAEDGVDPHYWLAVPNAQAIARNVAAALAATLPERRAGIAGNLQAYLAELAAADAETRRVLADLPTRRIATFHDAFGYFADAYGLAVVAVFEPFPGREPGPRFVRQFQERVRESGVRVVFAEPQLPLEVLRPVARDLGVALSVLDPLGGLPGRESYVELMRFNASQVAVAVRETLP